jgi:hypothetical protein
MKKIEIEFFNMEDLTWEKDKLDMLSKIESLLAIVLTSDQYELKTS